MIKFSDTTSIAVVTLESGDIMVGGTVRIKGSNSDFTQKVVMMEFNHQPVEKASPGHFAGIKFSQAARPLDLIYKVIG